MDAKRLIQEALNFDPENQFFKQFSALLAIGQHDFKTAYKNLYQSNNNAKPKLVQLCQDLEMYSSSNAKIPFALLSETLRNLDSLDHQTTLNQLLKTELKKDYLLKEKIEIVYQIMDYQHAHIENLFMDCVITKDQKLKINLGDQPLLNLGPLIALPIAELNLSKTKINDVVYLSLLEQLKSLNISYTQISNIKALNNTQLEFLDISHSRVYSIKNIKIPSLKTLKFDNLHLSTKEIVNSFPNANK